MYLLPLFFKRGWKERLRGGPRTAAVITELTLIGR